MKFEILDTEVIDNAYQDENGNYDVSCVSILVKLEIENKEYYLDFQTSNTYDYGAISSKLEAYDGTDDYEKLADMFHDDNDLQDLLEEIKKQSCAQEKWNDYISENYIRNEDHFGRMDAESEINSMKKLD